MSLTIALTMIFTFFGGVAAVTALMFYYRSGKNVEKLKQAEETVDAVLKSKKAVAGLTDDKRKRLRDKYGYRP